MDFNNAVLGIVFLFAMVAAAETWAKQQLTNLVCRIWRPQLHANKIWVGSSVTQQQQQQADKN